MEQTIKHYKLSDPRYDAEYIREDAEEMIEIAEKAGASRFQAITPDGQSLQVDKTNDGRWLRSDGVEVNPKQQEQGRDKEAPAQRGPAVGAMQIDDKDVTALRYVKTEKDSEAAYNVTFLMDNKTVVKLKGLNQTELENSVGQKNAETILKSETEKGTLRGSTLANEYGLSPEEAARRTAEKEALKEVQELEADDPAEQNIVSHEPERLEEIDVAEGLAMLARKRAAERRMEEERAQEREAMLAREQKGLADRAEGKRITVENLSEKAAEQDSVNRLAERTGDDPSYNDQLHTEREKNRQIELMEQVHHQFRVSGSKFHFKDQPQRIAFKDKGERMVSASNDDRVAHAMATMAEAKGWKTIRVSGHPEFRKEVWMEASLRGLNVRGYEPKEKDLQELESRLDKRSRNSVEQVVEKEKQRDSEGRSKAAPAQQKERATPEPKEQPGAALTAVRAYAGRVLEHGPAPYNHDPNEKSNYFVKLKTDKGEETVWGVDLKRAMADSKAKPGDDVRLEFQGRQPVTVTALERDKNGKVIGSKEIETNRNTWEVQKSDRAKVIEAVAAEVLKEKGVTDDKQRNAIIKAVNERLEQREKEGRVPAVPIYDKKAPSRQKQAERTRPQIERNAERTR